MPDNDVEEVKGPSDSGAEKNNLGNREESNALQDQRTEELFKDRDSSTERQASQQSDNSDSQVKAQAERDKSIADTSAAAKNGDSAALEGGIKNAFEQAKGDASKFREFGDKLGQSLKDSGIKVDTKDNSISLEKDGKAVTYSMNDQLDLNSGKVNAEVKAESTNGQNPNDVVAGFKSEKKDQQSSEAPADEKKEPLGAQGGSADLPPAQGARGINKENRVVQGPAADQNAEKPVTDQPAQKPVADANAEKPVTDQPAQKPVADANAEKPVTDQPAQKPVADANAVKPITDQPAQKPVADANAEKPVTDQPAQKPAADANAEKPITDQPAQKPVADQNAEKPVTDPAAQKPVADANAEKPVTDQPAQKPVADANVVKPVVDATAEKPAGQTTEKPAEQSTEKPAAAERQPSEILKDPKSSAEDKLRAARDMAKNGETKFKGDDGREYRISSQKYGDREGVVVSTTDSKNGFMPVLRGLVGQDGKVSHQRDSRGKEVDFTGTKASKELKNDAVLTTGKKADGDAPVKPETENKPEAKKKPAQEENPGDNNKPKGENLPKPAPNGRPEEADKPPVDNKDKPPVEQKKVGPLGSEFVPVDKPQQKVETIASVYAQPQGTASGRYFRPDEMTAAFNPAHLPKGLGLKDGDVIRVTHEGKSIDVTLTDRGPYVKGRGIDLSAAAGRALGITIEGKGIGKVSFEKIGREPGFKDAPRPKKK